MAKRKKKWPRNPRMNSAATTATPSAPGSGTLDHGFWLVAFVDLLGQQDAFLKTDYLPEEAQREAFVAAVKASVGVIKQLRRILDQFREGTKRATTDDSVFRGWAPEQIAKVRAMKQSRVRESRWSDGIMLAVPLKPAPGHNPIAGVYDVLCTCAALMLVQLAEGHPIRGGLDVGTGIVVDGELFGASLVKAYRIESMRAKMPRLVVGAGLVDYLRASTRAPGAEFERQFERMMATKMLGLLVQDSDGEWMIDYAGEQIRDLMAGVLFDSMLVQAQAFAHRARDEFKAQGPTGEKLFERYSCVVRYLDARIPWVGEGTAAQ